MSRRSLRSGQPASCPCELPAVEPGELGAVTGGLMGPRTTLDPVLLQGIEQLSQAIVSVGQNLAAAKQSSTQQLMQMIQHVLQARAGR